MKDAQSHSIYDYDTEQEAENDAYNLALEEYQSYEGCLGKIVKRIFWRRKCI